MKSNKKPKPKIKRSETQPPPPAFSKKPISQSQINKVCELYEEIKDLINCEWGINDNAYETLLRVQHLRDIAVTNIKNNLPE